jgi:hypothetical protein
MMSAHRTRSSPRTAGALSGASIPHAAEPTEPVDRQALHLTRELDRAARRAAAAATRGEPAPPALRHLEVLAHRYARRVGIHPVTALCNAWLAGAEQVDPLGGDAGKAGWRRRLSRNAAHVQ